MTESHSPGTVFRAARDLLLRYREDYPTARREFSWPRLERFNWALDWFDVIAAEHPERDALRIIAEGGSDVRLSYAELSARSSQVANWLRDLGVRRGDRVLLMLGNIAPLWEVILAAIKLGAVVIPATTLLGPDDVTDRITRGDVRHVITESAQTPKFGGAAGVARWTPIAVGEPADGWLSYDDAFAAAPRYTPDGVTLASDPLLLYFTSGTTAQPKLVEHTHASYPAGHLSTMYWLGLQPGDVHLNVSSPGWAKHAWSNVFAPWNAAATVMVLGHERFSVDALLAAIPGCGISSLCAPPTVWRMLIQSDLSGCDTASLRECTSAGEPLNPEVIEQVRRAWGITVRDGYGQTETTAQIGNPPGQEVRLGSMGRPLPGYTVVLVDPLTGVPGKEGEICLPAEPPAARPAGLMTGYRGDPQRAAEAMRDGYYHTGDVAAMDADGYITYVGTDRRRVQGERLPDLAVRAGERADRARGGGGGRGGSLPRPAAARGAQGVRDAGGRGRAVGAGGRVDPGLRPGPAGAVQAGAAAGVRRAAEDDLRQDPPGRTPRAGKRPVARDGAGHRRGHPRRHRVLGGRLPRPEGSFSRSR